MSKDNEPTDTELMQREEELSNEEESRNEGRAAEETTPDEKRTPGTETVEELWKLGQINFGQYRMMMNRAMREKVKVNSLEYGEIVLVINYVRTFPCGVCKHQLLVTKILNGCLLTCGCGTIFSKELNLEKTSWWSKVE